MHNTSKITLFNKCSKCDAVLFGFFFLLAIFPFFVPCVSAFGSLFALPFLAFLRRHFQFRGFFNQGNLFFWGEGLDELRCEGPCVGRIGAIWEVVLFFSCFWLFWCFFRFSVFRLFGGARCAISIAPNRVVPQGLIQGCVLFEGSRARSL